MGGSIVTLKSFGESMIPNRRSASVDCCGQDCPDCPRKSAGGLAIKIRTWGLGVDSSSEEGLVGVDVPHSSQHGLIEQSDFHRSAGSTKLCVESLAVDFRRFGPQAGQEPGLQVPFISNQVDSAESSGVDESDPNHVAGHPPEGPDHVTMGWDRARSSDGKIQAPRHSKANHQTATSVKPDQKLFSSAIESVDSQAFPERCRGQATSTASIQSTNHISSGDRDSIDLPPDHHGCEYLADCFDFGEFRHVDDFVRSTFMGSIGSGLRGAGLYSARCPFPRRVTPWRTPVRRPQRRIWKPHVRIITASGRPGRRRHGGSRDRRPNQR